MGMKCGLYGLATSFFGLLSASGAMITKISYKLKKLNAALFHKRIVKNFRVHPDSCNDRPRHHIYAVCPIQTCALACVTYRDGAC